MADNIYVQLLRDARKLVEAVDYNYVCCSISLASSAMGLGYYGTEAMRIRNKINSDMRESCPALVCSDDSSPIISQWLKGMGYEVPAFELKAYRLAWIDHMIEDWKDVK